MVWGNGRLNYLILKNYQFFIEKWLIFDRFFDRAGSNGPNYDFWSIRLTKNCTYSFGKTYFRKMSGQNSEIKEKFSVTIFVVMDG